MPTRKGSIHLFRLFGVDVFLHWWWFLVAVYEIQSRAGRYSSITWNVFEYLALFLIVLMHEFGHALRAGKLAEGPTGSCSGLSAEWLMSIPRNVRVQHCGVSRPGLWSTSR